MKVFINPGHAPEGNPDPGACNVYTGLRECDVAAEVGRLTAYYLKAVGIETEILQSDSLYEVCQKANASEADLFISIHCNSAANPAANGTETWYCHGSKNGANLAKYINGQILWTFDTADRGIKEARPGFQRGNARYGKPKSAGGGRENPASRNGYALFRPRILCGRGDMLV